MTKVLANKRIFYICNLFHHWLTPCSHYLSQFIGNNTGLFTEWLRSHDCRSIITLRPRQNGRHFTDDIFKCIFLNESVWIPIEISLKLVPKGPINNIPALVQIMAWRRPGDKPLSEPMMVGLLICVTRPQLVKLLHSPSLVVVGLRVVYQTRHPNMVGITFCECAVSVGIFSVAMDCRLIWSWGISTVFSTDSSLAQSPCAVPLQFACRRGRARRLWKSLKTYVSSVFRFNCWFTNIIDLLIGQNYIDTDLRHISLVSKIRFLNI